MAQLIARWESRSGKHWVELEYDEAAGSAFYRGPDCLGCLGGLPRVNAIAQVQAMVDSGYFQPDAAKTPMRRAV